MEFLLDAFLDSAKLVPFFLVTLFIMEYLEHRASSKLTGALQKAGRLGPVAGACLGCMPQCGFAAAVAHLYNGGFITAGTLVAVFLSASDEAIPILLGNPSGFAAIGRLVVVKVGIGIVAGLLLDFFWNAKKQQQEDSITWHVKSGSAENGKLLNIVLATCRRIVSIISFVFLATVLLNLLIESIGQERLSRLLLSESIFQPMLTALFGFIPNCAASVLITEFYLAGTLSFGSAVAGLCTSAGVGMLILLRGKHSLKTYAIVFGTLYLSAVIPGMLLQFIA